MTRGRTLVACFVGTALIALAYLSAFLADGPRWGVWCMITGLASLCVGVLALGTWHRTRRSTAVRVTLALTALAIVAGFGLAVLLPADENAISPLILGFPARAAAAIYIVGVAPLLVLPLVYALTFSSLTLTDAEIERVRAARLPDSAP